MSLPLGSSFRAFKAILHQQPYPYFMDEESEAQRSEANCSRSHNRGLIAQARSIMSSFRPYPLFKDGESETQRGKWHNCLRLHSKLAEGPNLKLRSPGSQPNAWS